MYKVLNEGWIGTSVIMYSFQLYFNAEYNFNNCNMSASLKVGGFEKEVTTAAPNILLTAKVDNFWGHLGNSGPENMKKLRNNLENARRKIIFAPCRRIP